jgi:hypothetical protein
VAVGRTLGDLSRRLPGALLAGPRRVPGVVGDGLRDLRSFVRVGAILEQADARLAAIESRVDTLNDEVARMRRGVDSVGVEAAGIRDGVGPLGEKLDHVAQSVEPLRRFRGRRARRGERLDGS